MKTATRYGWTGPVILAAIVLAGTSLAAAAQDGGSRKGDAMAGTVISLDGGAWTLAQDPQNVGRDQQWWKNPPADAKPAPVPGLIQEVYPRYHGVAWYWREFTAPAHPQGRFLLRFWAVDYLADVWVNDVRVGGHEGGETPFVLDTTDAVKANAPNRLTVRVLNPTGTPIDGYLLAETPHRNKTPSLVVGSMLDYGGILESVEVILAPAVRVADVFVQPDWKTGKVRVQATVRNAANAPAKGRIDFCAGPARLSEIAAAVSLDRDFPPGDTMVEADLEVPNHRLWDVDDPFLYRLTTQLSTDAGGRDESATRFGFRDFRVERGYFRLNGRRIFLRSSHTGNHCPVGQVIPPEQARDLLQKDLLYAKASGFNAMRFIAGVAHPWQLDLCDEMGLMVYQETLAGWCLTDSPKMADRFDLSIREMVLRDRNHPSVTIWGLLNETGNGPVFRHAVESLKLVRSLDDTRLVLLGSGRWDCQYNIGSASNPGSAQWECVWGVESPDNTVAGKAGAFGGYFEGAGDAHVYPGTPHTPAIEDGIRTLGRDTKPVFLSEYGIGSLMNAVRELRTYEQHGIRTDLEDFEYFRATVEKLNADWARFGLDTVYPFPEDMLRESQRLHCRQRLLGFDLIRSNPKICGYNVTGLLDHGFTGEGLWTFWREWKPGIVDALQDGWAPLRWCLFVRPMNGRLDRPFKIEAVLANEDALKPGEYPVTLKILGPAGIAWEQKTTVKVPQPAPGEDGPLAIPVFTGDVTLNGPPGPHTFAANLESGGAPAGGRLKFYVAGSGLTTFPGRNVTICGLDSKVQAWLQARGLVCTPFETASPDERQIVLVGDLSQVQAGDAMRVELMRRIARGSSAVFLTPRAFKRGDDPVGWMPLKTKGRLVEFPDWLYHKECIAKGQGIFEGLQANGIMDWDYYGPVISHAFFEGQETPAAVFAVAIAICHSAPPGGYSAGVMIGEHKFGAGRFILNTLNVIDNLDQHPAAGQLLINLIQFATNPQKEPATPLPPDFDAKLKEIGYP